MPRSLPPCAPKVWLGPVGVRLAVPPAVGDEFVPGAQQAGRVLEVDVLFGFHHLRVMAQGAPGELIIVEDTSVLGLRAALGGDEDDTVTGLRTIDGGGSGVLQDLHGLDHGRIQVLDVVHFQAIHDQERAEAGTAVGGDTADADMGLFTRSARIGIDLDTGGLALQGGGGIGGGTVHQFLGTDGRHRTGEVALALDTVADDHGLIQEFGVLLQDDLDLGLVADGNHLRGVTDAGDFDTGAGRDGQAESAVRVGPRADGRVADQHDGGPDDGSARGIDHGPPDRPVLGGDGDATQTCQQNRQRACQTKQFFKHGLE